MQETLGELTRALDAHDEIVVAYLFGSAARGTMSALSDVDVGILLAREPDNRLRYRARLADELSRHTHAPVQVVLLDEAAPALAARAVRERAVLLCRDDTERVRFEIRTIRRDLDTAQLRRIHEQAQTRAIREGRFYG